MSDSNEQTAPQEGAEASAPVAASPEVDAGSPVEQAAAPTEAAPAEAAPVEAAPEKAAKPEAAAKEKGPERPAFMQLLEDTLGDDSSNLDDFVTNLKDSDIKDLSPEGRQIIKNLLRASRGADSHKQSEFKAKEVSLNRAAKELNERARGLNAQRMALLKLLQRPEMKEAMKSEISDDDLLTPDGQKAYLNKLFATKWSESLQPLEKETKVEAQRHAYRSWSTDKPELKDPGFRSRMKAKMDHRNSVGVQLLTEDAYFLVKSEVEVEKAVTKRRRENSIRAASARAVGRGSGTADKPARPPRGAKAHEIAAWVKKNPGHRSR